MELTNRLKLGKYTPLVAERLITEKVLVDEGMVLRLADFGIKLSPAQQAKIDVFLKAMAEQPYAPPSELIPQPDLLNLLIERKQAVKLSEGVVLSTKAYNEMVDKVMGRLAASGRFTLSEMPGYVPDES